MDPYRNETLNDLCRRHPERLVIGVREPHSKYANPGEKVVGIQYGYTHMDACHDRDDIYRANDASLRGRIVFIAVQGNWGEEGVNAAIERIRREWSDIAADIPVRNPWTPAPAF